MSNAEATIKIKNNRKSTFIEKVKEILPEGGNLNLCLTCGACASGCPATGLENMDPRKFLRMAALGLDDEITGHPWVWMCSLCQRCVYVCPMSINIPALVNEARMLWPREERPKGILASCDMALRNDSCSAMGSPPDDFIFVVEDVCEEVKSDQPGWENLEAPMDKEGAEFFLTQNSREPVTEPEEMAPLWKILHLAGVDWTYGSTGWGGENYCMFLADDKNWKATTELSIRKAESLGCKIYLNTECGHATYAVWMGVQRHKIKTDLEIAPIVPYYARWIREGRLNPSSDWNKDMKIKFTCQDPCQQVRKSFGDPLAEDLRFVIKACVGEENFVDMTPNRSNNFCCGGGGGYLQSGYNEARHQYGKIKFDQVMATGAKYVITPCHNCHAQIHDLNDHFNGGYHTIHLWSLLALSLGALADTERVYLGEDLQEVWLPGEPGTPNPFEGR
ncbi:oxidoreductase [Desulfosarcina ovata subsp. sediminis]|uniref:Oxidoreductase n=1 Tax=Desulfosarcina ovata subsp. sediminis TaxID=885957 RepID=A0A5K7ZJQ4_9BACT|nr:(Fe-S)-binding protein [Desulfosarcina ovata]BBO82382.1 oxidoreductase [Desulfosarcina ovata subsp. sediminis]